MQQKKERLTLNIYILTSVLWAKGFKPILISKTKKTKNELKLIYRDEILYYLQKSAWMNSFI